ncbi:MAG: hypothetical protein AAFP90_01000 [Planctomycetota bacterium]
MRINSTASQSSNACYSDNEHQFNDVFGAAENYSEVSFPHRDSDIYGNDLRDCLDDAIELEGGNRNVRIWGNRIQNSHVAIATATTSVGPLYVFRNVIGASRKSPQHPATRDKLGVFLKHSDRMVGGRIYVYHNTLLSTNALRRIGGRPPTQRVGTAMGWGGPIVNVVSRNNVIDVGGMVGINDRTRHPQTLNRFCVNGLTSAFSADSGPSKVSVTVCHCFCWPDRSAANAPSGKKTVQGKMVAVPIPTMHPRFTTTS